MNKVIRCLVSIIMLMYSVCVLAQSNGDKLFMEGQRLQQTQTIAAQNQAIKKFQAAKVVYTTADKKTMCDNQIAICNSNIASIKKGGKTTRQQVQTPAPKTVKLALSRDFVDFDGDKKGVYNIVVTAPSMDWNFTLSNGVDGEQSFVRANRSSDAKSIDLEVDANPYTIERYQTLKVTLGEDSKILKISQKGKNVTLSTSSNLVEFKLKGGSKSIELYTNSDSIIASNNNLTWYVVSKPDWVETSVEVKKEKGILGKGLSAVKEIVSGTASAATANDVKISNVKIVARPLVKTDPDFLTGRKGEVVFASQDKRYTINVLQQK